MSDQWAVRPKRLLSLGAGVQSTTIALMAAHGEIPAIDVAIFADTQSEPQKVYAHLERLSQPGVLPFPIVIVTKGSLKQEILDACEGKRGAWGRPPLFVLNPDGSHGMTNRQCTQDYKIDLINREARFQAGIKPRARGPKTVAIEQLIGISTDEAHRMKDASFRWIQNSYPLVDLGMNRGDCVRKLASYGWTAPKSACTFCPYHSDRMWLDMKEHDTAAWEEAVQMDRALRSHHGVAGVRGQVFLHEERKPLELVNFGARLARPKRKKQLRLYLSGGFGNDCSGSCGV